jgi:hypothetical protein
MPVEAIAASVKARARRARRWPKGRKSRSVVIVVEHLNVADATNAAEEPA